MSQRFSSPCNLPFDAWDYDECLLSMLQQLCWRGSLHIISRSNADAMAWSSRYRYWRTSRSTVHSSRSFSSPRSIPKVKGERMERRGTDQRSNILEVGLEESFCRSEPQTKHFNFINALGREAALCTLDGWSQPIIIISTYSSTRSLIGNNNNSPWHHLSV